MPFPLLSAAASCLGKVPVALQVSTAFVDHAHADHDSHATVTGVAHHGAGHDHAGSDHAATGSDSSQAPRIDKELLELQGGKVKIDLLNNNNSQYYGDFTLGRPRQRFTAVFDTGSGITWVPGAKCHSDTCVEHHRFDKGESPDFSDASENNKGSIHYGTGEVKYEGGTDTLTFCDSHDNVGCHGNNEHVLEVPHHSFGMSTDQTSNPFRILPFDGILGLAPSKNAGSVLHQLRATKALSRNVFGVYLSEDTHRSGSMDFGGIEPSHIAPGHSVHWHPIQRDDEWQVGLKDIAVNGKLLHLCDKRPGGICPAVVDSGSSLITGPSDEIDKLLPEIHTADDCTNIGKMPEVSLILVDKNGHNVSYPLTPEEYTLRSWDEVPGSADTGYFKEFPFLGRGGKEPDVKPRCEPGIGIMDVPGKKWVIGDTMLRRYYSIYDDDRGQVGFVRSVHPDENLSQGQESQPQWQPGSPKTDLNEDTAVRASMPWPLGLPQPPPSTRKQWSPTSHRRASWTRFL